MPTDEIRVYILDQLRDMNYDTSTIHDETELGPSGLDLEDVALVELCGRLEVQYGVKFSDEDQEVVQVMTLGELITRVESPVT
jgi:acyl carrier protein